MSDVVAELSHSLTLSDPKPDRCAACFCGADAGTRFVNFDSSIDRGAIVEEGSLAVLESIDELHLCESCIRNAAELVGLKPELHGRQLREIRRLEIERDHFRDTSRRLKDELGRQIDANMGEPAARRTRKAA